MEIYVWLALVVIFLVVEGATPQLVSVWFALGSVAGLILAAFNVPLWVQIFVAVLVSLISLLVTRPFVKRITERRTVSTNADRVIGKTAVVTEEINDVLGTGRVNVMGSNWAAVVENGMVLHKGDEATVDRIEGVKLVVRPKISDSAI